MILCLLPVYGFSQPAAPQPGTSAGSLLGNLRVSLMEGDIQIKTVGFGDWAPASINLPLEEGDELWVPENGRLEVQIAPASYVRLDQNSSLGIVTVSKGAEQTYLSQGHAYINFNPSRDGMMQIDTPISSIQGFERAVFKIDVTEQGYTDVSVLDGRVYVESKGGKTTLEAGNVLSLREATDAELSPLSDADDWEAWNADRDKQVFARRESGRYLPEELQGYSSDFDRNGKWIYVKDYGRVWTPTVVVSAEWAPYRVGRWTWIGADYVWVSYEPWGWAPYHYGRWAFTTAVGWFWVPPVAGGVYWGPGYVGWVYTPDYVAWVPLAPREVYYGYGYYGPHSVDLHHVDRNSVRVTNVYRNVYINNSITIVSNTTFVRGHAWGAKVPESPLRFTDVSFRGNPFLENRIHVGRPLIKAERSTMISINREISITRQPPQRIREVNISTVRETRRIVPDRNVSAFSNIAITRTLTVKPREGIEVNRSIEQRRVVGPGGQARLGGAASGSIKKTTAIEGEGGKGPLGTNKGQPIQGEGTKRGSIGTRGAKGVGNEANRGPFGIGKGQGTQGDSTRKGPVGMKRTPGGEAETSKGPFGIGKSEGAESEAIKKGPAGPKKPIGLERQSSQGPVGIGKSRSTETDAVRKSPLGTGSPSTVGRDANRVPFATGKGQGMEGEAMKKAPSAMKGGPAVNHRNLGAEGEAVKRAPATVRRGSVMEGPPGTRGVPSPRTE